MNLTFQNIPNLVLVGAALLAVIFGLRFLFKLAWRLVRVALIVISVVLAAGYFLGFLEMILP
jgi:lysylphosphatidylglycerol synthetase-like protein (DUF2156 family)